MLPVLHSSRCDRSLQGYQQSELDMVVLWWGFKWKNKPDFSTALQSLFWPSLKDVTSHILINSQIKCNLQGFFSKEMIPLMYKTLNMSSILCIRYALQIFREILKALLIEWVKEKKGLGISAGKTEILKSVRLAKYKASDFWKQFKLEHNIISSWEFVCGFWGFSHLSVCHKCPQSSIMRWLCPVEQVTPSHAMTTLTGMKPRGTPTFKPPGKLTGEWLVQKVH